MSGIPKTVPLREINELDRAIVNLSTRINAETYELLVLVREFDERAGWLKWGFTDCASWLHWRCDLSVGAARKKVRVAGRGSTTCCFFAPAISTSCTKAAIASTRTSRIGRTGFDSMKVPAAAPRDGNVTV
jgi:hypothetical protein